MQIMELWNLKINQCLFCLNRHQPSMPRSSKMIVSFFSNETKSHVLLVTAE